VTAEIRNDVIVATEHIKAPPEVVFPYFTDPALIVEWIGRRAELDPRPGGLFHLDFGDTAASGAYTSVDPPHRLVFTWAAVAEAADPNAYSRVTFDIEPMDGMVKLTVTHDQLVPGSSMEKGITQGWPRVLSSLKTLLETGKPLPTWAKAKAAR